MRSNKSILGYGFYLTVIFFRRCKASLIVVNCDVVVRWWFCYSEVFYLISVFCSFKFFNLGFGEGFFVGFSRAFVFFEMVYRFGVIIFLIEVITFLLNF